MWEKYTFAWPNVQAAIANCTPIDDFPEVFFNSNKRNQICWSTINCAIQASDPYQQAHYSAAATILGLLPTILSMMSTSVDELLQIHARFPVLAFLLSLCNPSTISPTLYIPEVPTHVIGSRRSAGLKKILFHKFRVPLLGLYGFTISTLWLHDAALHLLAAGAASVLFYNAIQLGYRAVVVNACDTWWDPLIWVSIGGIIHIIRVITWRLCLGSVNPEQSPGRWKWNLAESGANLHARFRKVARFMEVFFQFFSIMNYGFGTVMLSATTLINMTPALFIFWELGLSGLAGRLIALWVLQVYPDIPLVKAEENREERIVLQDRHPKYQKVATI